ncbi:CDP-diacylglycerol--glycerol-3-phosphate 3-phosphatidyltransferase [Moritella yayanosii]|uniref:CDP-diacylglycerol--glycerol-3-phosphate 3-phosphatidyltransferase n=1 Tax=Moritella yayanosii TaxID=69539 RepID=A0A330M295_9GAMM|nr:CDP-diacylglycerol--glycerol-3-phosphate 3-phosphatidyltransferase [Moritella yayanosii]SQD80575.1 phosphatidylglycerophosphate synthetase [Moritella yayanosii]
MKNIPNILTLFRVILIPFFVLAFYLPIENSFYIAASIFFIAGVTDYLDGYIARRWNVSSKLGAFLDPVADKIMVITALVMVVGDHDRIAATVGEHSALWIMIPTLIMIGRELAISGLREWMADLGKRANVAVGNAGKWKTSLQMLALGGFIWQQGPWMVYLAYLVFYAAMVLTVVSMLQYFAAAWGELTSED